jgi:hypothetical protein
MNLRYGDPRRLMNPVQPIYEGIEGERARVAVERQLAEFEPTTSHR